MGKIKWILKYIKQIKWTLLYTIILLIIEKAFELSLIGIQKFIIDDVFIQGNFKMLTPLLVSLAISAVLFNVLHLYASQVRIKGQNKFQQIILTDLMKKLYNVQINSFQKHGTGKYVQNLTNDVNQVTSTFCGDLPMGIMNLSGAIMISVIIGYNSFPIFIGIMIISFFYILLGKHFGPLVKKASLESANKKSDLLVHIEEGISSTREVVAFNRQNYEKSKYNKLFDKYFVAVMKENKLLNKQLLTIEPFKWSVSILVLGYGGYCVLQNTLSIGIFVIIYQFSSELLVANQKVFNFFINISRNVAFVDRVQEVFDMENEMPGEQTLEGKINSIKFSKIDFRYESNSPMILKQLNFDIPIGKKVAFVGGSGSGKSTISQLLVRFHQPTTGDILINKFPLSQIKSRDWRQKINIVFQEPFLFPVSIMDNLQMGRNISEDKVIDICKKMQIHDFILKFPHGYDTDIGERGVKLSGGQKQRLALARALLSESEILILDEATSALDVRTEHHIQKFIDELRKGKTTIVIAHRLSTIINSDLIYVLENGETIEAGTHKYLLRKSGKYAELVLSSS